MLLFFFYFLNMLFKNVSFFLSHWTLHKKTHENPTSFSSWATGEVSSTKRIILYDLLPLKVSLFDMFIAGRHLNTYWLGT